MKSYKLITNCKDGLGFAIANDVGIQKRLNVLI